jgi:hypothetical protein
MKKLPYIIGAILILLAAYGLFAGLRSLQLNKATAALEGLELENGLLVEPVTYKGENYLIPPNLIFDAGTSAESMPSIDDAKYESVASADTELADEVHGVILAIGNTARFYSYQIMNLHEVVNETIGDQKIAITHCSLCRSSLIFNRELNGQELNFEISGQVYNNNTLLRDRETGSLWLQATGLAVSGELIGSQLEIIPAPVMTWKSFKESFPVAEALSTDTGFERDSTRHPYLGYDGSDIIYFPLNSTDNRIVKKWIVNGVTMNGEYLAFSEKVIAGSRVQHDIVGGEEVVALFDLTTEVTSVFKPYDSEGNILTLSYDFEEELITDETGSTWTAYGLAIDGPLAGTRLEQIAAPDMFWFCWSALHPDTGLNQID